MIYKPTLACLALTAAILSASTALHAQQTYQTDQGHTEVLFSWTHAGITPFHGEFTKVSGTLELQADKPETSNLNVTIDASSISTGFEALDDRLKSDHWFDVTKFPEMAFQSTSIELTGDKTAKVTGDLTMHGITAPVVLDTVIVLQGGHPLAQYIEHYKGDWVAFRATAEIDHQAFGLGAYSTGPISLEINTQLKGQ